MSSVHDLSAWCHGSTLPELVRVARGLAEPCGEEAFPARLGPLTEEQRAELAAMGRAAGKDR